MGFKQVDIIDKDLGASAAAGSRERPGFQQLLTRVAVGDVGIILTRELSRLSRTDKDGCHLMEICQFSNTLLGDDETVYDPNQFDDQLVLGIKGTISVAELSVLRMRLLQGKEAKAKRGELFTVVPGYSRDADRIVKDPNRRVQDAFMRVFKQFQELGSIRQTYGWFMENGVELPVNKSIGGQIQRVWKLPAQTFIPSVLHKPIYAGAYVYGRRPIEKVLKNGQVRKQQAAIRTPEQAKVFIKDHHEGYISWETYLRHPRMIENNGTNFQPDPAILAVREGHGLLTGLLRCARCGHKLHVRYWGKHKGQHRDTSAMAITQALGATVSALGVQRQTYVWQRKYCRSSLLRGLMPVYEPLRNSATTTATTNKHCKDNGSKWNTKPNGRFYTMIKPTPATV